MELIVCWNCTHNMSETEFYEADGFCPKCDCEIDLTEPPYVPVEKSVWN